MLDASSRAPDTHRCCTAYLSTSHADLNQNGSNVDDRPASTTQQVKTVEATYELRKEVGLTSH